MLKISLFAVGEKMPHWVNQGFDDYAKRIRGKVQFTLNEIVAEKRGKNADLAKLIQHEEKKFIAALPNQFHLVVLDRQGVAWSTLELSKQLECWMKIGKPVVLGIGGPEGFSDDFIKSADQCWSLSKLTLPHPMARVLLAEQLYRALSIIDRSPYHR